MRPSRLTIVATITSLAAASLLLSLFACGSSSNGNNPGPTTPTPDATAGSGDGGFGSPTGDGGGTGNDSSPTGDDGGSSGDGSACNAPSAAGFAPAQKPYLPDMVYSGGGILTQPKMVTFTFTDTFEPSTVAAFGKTITQTPWFAAVSKDYCV